MALRRALRYPSYISVSGALCPAGQPAGSAKLAGYPDECQASDLLSEENQQFEGTPGWNDKGEAPLGENYLEADDEAKGDLITLVKSKFE